MDRREYEQKNREHIRQRENRWRDENRERVRAINNRSTAKWFEKHRDEWNAKNRAKYASDAEFREERRAYNALMRERVRAGHIPKPKPVHRTIDGEPVRLYRSSEAARMIGCAPMSITNWIREGWIPEPHFDRHRLFTRTQIDLLGFFYEQNQRDHERRSRISKLIFKIWSE